MADDGMFSLAGQTAVVIGGGGVLAGAMALGLARAGADIAIVDVNLENAEARAHAIAATGRQAMGIRCDATSKADLESALAAAIGRFGRVDTLINAAGINSGTPFFEIGEAEWQRILDIDLKSVFLACQVFGKAMVEAGRGGSIINISSASAGPPLSKVFTYSIAKAGINQITQFLARDLAPHNVRVNAIQPGFFPAEQNRKLLTDERVASIMTHTPMNRFGDSEELVGAAVYLASPRASSFVTGSILRVDGGFLAMLATWQTWVLLIVGGGGFFLLQNALQAGRLVASQPGITLANPLVAGVCGVGLFHEQVRTGPWLLGAGLGAALLAAGAVLLSSSPLLVGHQEAPDNDG